MKTFRVIAGQRQRVAPASGLMARAQRQNPVPVSLLSSVQVARCIGCGCTDLAACKTILGPCFWIKVDYKTGNGVCSECVHKLGEYETIISEARKTA